MCSAWPTRRGTTCKAGGRKTAGLEDLHLTLTRLLGEQHTVFEESWQRLTLAQRAVLRALVLEHGRELLSAEVRTRHRLPGASTIPMTFIPYWPLAVVTTERITAFSPGASPPPVSIPMVLYITF